MNKIFLAICAVSVFALSACTPSPSQLKKAMEDNPDILVGAIEKNPEQILNALSKASVEQRQRSRESQAKEMERQFEEQFKNPLQPQVDEARVFDGDKAAAVTIVEYSDFQCPHCADGFQTMKEILKAYQGKVRIFFKHLPFQPMAMPVAKMFEAIAAQSHEKALKFQAVVFSQQAQLRSPKAEAWLLQNVKKLGVDMAKFKKDMESDEVAKRIEGDVEEARKFNFNGTPGFLVNGVAVRGAYPLEHFKMIIDRHLAKN